MYGDELGWSNTLNMIKKTRTNLKAMQGIIEENPKKPVKKQIKIEKIPHQRISPIQ